MLSRVVFRGVENAILLAEHVRAVIAGHAQEGLTGVLVQPHRFRRAAAEGRRAHFAYAVEVVLHDDDADGDLVVFVRVKILDEEGDQAVFVRFGGVVQGRLRGAGDGNIRVFNRLAVRVPDDEAELLARERDDGKIHAVHGADVFLLVVGELVRCREELVRGCAGQHAGGGIGGVKTRGEIELVLFEQIVILIVIARDGFDDGLELSHVLAHAQREAQPRLLGQGGGFQTVQVVVDGQPPLLQLVAIEGEPVAQLLQRSGDGAEGGAPACFRQFQQLGAVEDFVH